MSAGDPDTMDVYPQTQAQPQNDKVFGITNNPSGFPIGLTWLNIDRRSDICISAFAEPLSRDLVKIRIDALTESILYAAGCTCLTTHAKNCDFQFGRFSTLDNSPFGKPRQQNSSNITFPQPFHGKAPKVIVWLNEFHMSNSANWRCKAYVTDITTKGFTIHIDTWASTILHSATASWIAYDADCPDIMSGSFNTMDVRPWYIPKTKNKGTAEFQQLFKSIPRVLAAINWLDISNRTNLRLKLEIGDVGVKGLTWQLDAWDDTILYSAGASYIAILDS